MSFKTANLRLKSVTAVILFTSIAIPSFAEAAMSPEQRLERIENILSSQVLMEQSQRVEQIQQELTSLRGLLESQENQLNLIKQRQRNLYQDIDRRLNDVEIKGGITSSSGSSASSSGAPVASPIAPPSAAESDEMTESAPLVDDSDKNGKSAYTQAFNTLKEGRYADAITAFKAFQKNYPQSAYGANAQYWLGEAYSVSRDYKTSLTEFQRVVSDYPDSNKVEGALLKIGFTYYEMQDWASAKTALELVANKYPGTTVARKARERLQRITREGH